VVPILPAVVQCSAETCAKHPALFRIRFTEAETHTAGAGHQGLWFSAPVKSRHWRYSVMSHRKIYPTAQGYVLSRLNHLVATGTSFMLVLSKLEKLDGKLEYFRFLATVSFLSFASSGRSRQTEVCFNSSC